MGHVRQDLGTKACGKYRFSVTPTVKNGSYTYRVVSAPFKGYAKGISSTVSFARARAALSGVCTQLAGNSRTT